MSICTDDYNTVKDTLVSNVDSNDIADLIMIYVRKTVRADHHFNIHFLYRISILQMNSLLEQSVYKGSSICAFNENHNETTADETIVSTSEKEKKMQYFCPSKHQLILVTAKQRLIKVLDGSFWIVHQNATIKSIRNELGLNHRLIYHRHEIKVDDEHTTIGSIVKQKQALFLVARLRGT
eukprot:111821_1